LFSCFSFFFFFFSSRRRHTRFSRDWSSDVCSSDLTCTPFFFYDLDYEIQTPLKITSYHLLDYSLLKINSLLDKKKALNELINEVKKVNGEFVPVFHNYTFSDVDRWKGYKELFNIILESANED